MTKYRIVKERFRCHKIRLNSVQILSVVDYTT